MQSTVAVISVSQIRKNLDAVKALVKVPLIAVVKDDAYGHGAERVSLAIEPHVDGFAVASVSEGVALRTAGVSREILVLTPLFCEEDVLQCAAHGLTSTVSSGAGFEICRAAAKRFKVPLRFHLKVNTGMNRYGVAPSEAEELCLRAASCGAEVTGVFSHLYAPEDGAAREMQRRRFDVACAAVKRIFPNAVRHLAATGGILAGREFHYDLVRCGIALYGYLPSGFAGAIEVRPAMKIYAAIVQSFPFTGGGVCYQRAKRDYGTLSTLRLGYGDGFFRNADLGNVNALCMDACVREGESPIGSYKLVFGDAERYAKENGTIVYDALVSVGRKAEKRYV